ncbi:MAG: hypothetical protein VKO39_06970 [Cyanobacteriota bacterium]|nr:hypothetical protein [Cyanobacteriota bacterium]
MRPLGMEELQRPLASHGLAFTGCWVWSLATDGERRGWWTGATEQQRLTPA